MVLEESNSFPSRRGARAAFPRGGPGGVKGGGFAPACAPLTPSGTPRTLAAGAPLLGRGALLVPADVFGPKRPSTAQPRAGGWRPHGDGPGAPAGRRAGAARRPGRASRLAAQQRRTGRRPGRRLRGETRGSGGGGGRPAGPGGSPLEGAAGRRRASPRTIPAGGSVAAGGRHNAGYV